MKSFKIFLLSGLLWLPISLKGQTVLITDADYDQASPVDCSLFDDGSVQNFYDSGNSGANYSDNEDETIVICPNLTQNSKLTIAFGINAGYSFNVDGSDSIYVFDGPSIVSPLLGVHNSVTDPNGFTYTSSWNNPSGCLTVRFRSDAAVTGTGWAANITCGSPAQPFEAHMEAFVNGTGSNAINPADTGYVDICFGDSIRFDATPFFPHSSDVTGTGYSQNLSNVTIEWDFSDGTSQTGPSVWFKPPARSGFLVSLKITDDFPQTEVMQSKVRVSTIPSFAGAGPLDDTICAGATTEIIGGITVSDTAGVDPTSTSFQLGGIYAGLTYLPDGSGQQYTTTIPISGFPPGQTVAAASDIQSLCITMEHSYLGDLEMTLTCPNGTTVNIFNSYSPGMIPGGFSGGTTFLGDADDTGNGSPGIGWEYCFSDVLATWGNMATEYAAGNTVGPTSISFGQAMNPNGVYQPEQSFSAFIGCPINGNWTITVQDNLSIDDGYIFEWGILFDPLVNPNNEVYAPVIVTEQWLPDPTILTGGTDTAIIVMPPSPGTYDYVFQVTDNFGCTYDTTVVLEVIAGPTIMPDTVACNGAFQISGTTSPAGGVWQQISGLGSTVFSPSANAENPLITVPATGFYEYTYTDNRCNQTLNLQVFFGEAPTVDIEDQEYCDGEEFAFDVTSALSGVTYLWTPGNGTSAVFSPPASGVYTITVSNLCGSDSDSSIVVIDPCELVVPNIFSPNSDNINDDFVVTGLEKYQNSRLYIYNRWGQLVYESSNYLNNWDGKTKSGNDVSDGTYFFVLLVEKRGELIDYKGTVNIVRN